jgi:hypothetical protein
LFPQFRKNKYNRRNDSASKENSAFVRGLGITDSVVATPTVGMPRP